MNSRIDKFRDQVHARIRALVQRKLGSASSRIAVRKLAANRTVYINHVNAAGHIRNPGLEAAKLRRAAGVIAGGMRNLTRGEAGMRICF